MWFLTSCCCSLSSGTILLHALQTPHPLVLRVPSFDASDSSDMQLKILLQGLIL